MIRGLAHFYNGPSGQVFAQLIGEGQSDPLVRKELRAHLVMPRRLLMTTIWDRGVARGELRSDIDTEAAVDLLIGPILYRLLLGHAPLDDAGADVLVDTAMASFTAR